MRGFLVGVMLPRHNGFRQGTLTGKVPIDDEPPLDRFTFVLGYLSYVRYELKLPESEWPSHAEIVELYELYKESDLDLSFGMIYDLRTGKRVSDPFKHEK